MKKNYSEPKVKVQTIALQSMMTVSDDEPTIDVDPINPSPGDGDAKDNLLDGLFD